MKPDFSGEYVLNRQACVLSASAAAFQSAVMRIAHREPTFRCSAAFEADGKTFEFSFERAIDGLDVPAGENEVSRFSWDGDAIVSEFRTGGTEPIFTMIWRYELMEGGRRLRATERMRGAGRDQDNVWEFERK